jgi:hypothetical protein
MSQGGILFLFYQGLNSKGIKNKELADPALGGTESSIRN